LIILPTYREILAKKYKISRVYPIIDNILIFSVQEHCRYDTAGAFATVILVLQSLEFTTMNKHSLSNQEFHAFTLLKQTSYE